MHLIALWLSQGAIPPHAVVVPVCNGTDYAHSDAALQLTRAALVATSLRSTGCKLPLVALTRGFGRAGHAHLRRAGFDHVHDVSQYSSSEYALVPLTERPQMPRGPAMQTLEKWRRSGGAGSSRAVPSSVRKWVEQRVQRRKDYECTSIKFFAWNLTSFEHVLLVDSDVIWLEDVTEWMERQREHYLVASLEFDYRRYLGLNSHVTYLQTSELLFRILRDTATSGNFIPFTNGDQDIIETVFPPQLPMPELPRHVHAKALWCDLRTRSIMECVRAPVAPPEPCDTTAYNLSSMQLPSASGVPPQGGRRSRAPPASFAQCTGARCHFLPPAFSAAHAAVSDRAQGKLARKSWARGEAAVGLMPLVDTEDREQLQQLQTACMELYEYMGSPGITANEVQRLQRVVDAVTVSTI